MYRISSGDSLVLIGTRTAPASGTPKLATSICGVFGHRYATRSPGRTPDTCRARARRVASAPNSRYVKRRSPYTIAVLSGKTSADLRRNANGVRAVNDTSDMRPHLLGCEYAGRLCRLTAGHRRPQHPPTPLLRRSMPTTRPADSATATRTSGRRLSACSTSSTPPSDPNVDVASGPRGRHTHQQPHLDSF